MKELSALACVFRLFILLAFYLLMVALFLGR